MQNTKESKRIETAGYIAGQIAFVFLLAILCSSKPSAFLVISALVVAIINLVYSYALYSRWRSSRTLKKNAPHPDS